MLDAIGDFQRRAHAWIMSTAGDDDERAAIEAEHDATAALRALAEMTPEQAAEIWAGLGFPVVLLHGATADGLCTCGRKDCGKSTGKHPRLRDWPRLASSELATVRAQFGGAPGSNVGLRMGGPQRLVAVDVDGPVGRATLASLEAQHGMLPETLSTASGRDDGGEHRVFRVPVDLDIGAIPNGVGRARASRHPGIDVRAEGGQIVAPPSVHYTGRPYRIVQAAPVADMPRWLYDVLAASPEQVAPASLATPPRWAPMADERTRRARAYLRLVPGAVDGDHGGTNTFLAAQKLRGFDLNEEEAYSLMASEFNPRCVPPWSEKDLRRKVREAYEKGYAIAPGSKLEERRGHSGGGNSSDDSRPIIQAGSGQELHRIVAAAEKALGRDAELYQRDGQLVHVVRVVEADAERERVAAGTPQIRAMALATLRVRLSEVASWVRYDARRKEWVPCKPDDAAALALLAQGQWSTVRPIAGVIEAPSMRPDGSIIELPGYDAATGYLYVPSVGYPPVPATASQAQASAALQELLEPWSEMAWATPAASYVPAAAVLSVLARPAIRGPVPGICIDASVRGAGKTLAAQAIAVLATGRAASPLTWPADDTEREKVLGALALRGATIALWDNIEGTFGGAPLDKVLTAADRVALRVLGQSTVPELAWRALLVATGNGMVIGGDTSRRVLLARQEPAEENPEERTGWRHDPLLAWCIAERPRLVAAGLTVLRAYVAAGRPSMGLRPWGSFEAWSALVPAAIVWAGGPDVMACRPTVAGADDEAATLRALLEGWARLVPEGATARSVVDTLYPRERLRGDALPPDGLDDMRAAIEALVPTRHGHAPDVRRLGYSLRRIRGRVIGGKRISSLSGHAAITVWRVDDAGAA